MGNFRRIMACCLLPPSRLCCPLQEINLNKKKTMFFKDSRRLKKSKVTRKMFELIQCNMHMYTHMYACVETLTQMCTQLYTPNRHTRRDLVKRPNTNTNNNTKKKQEK